MSSDLQLTREWELLAKPVWEVVSKHKRMEKWRIEGAKKGFYRSALFGVKGKDINDPILEKKLGDRQVEVFRVYDKYDR